ncbi:MAG: glucose-6-phosphate isomerase, partial [Halobacteriales archaeon]
LFCCEAASVLAGELFDVNALDLPAVEWGKDATRELLRTGEMPDAPGDETLTVE